jgi:hypothetical protein
MHRDHQEQYLEAMKVEVASLLKQRTQRAVPRSEAPHVLKATWVFKLKRLPDGTPSKFKGRFCVRGDLQKEWVDFFLNICTCVPMVHSSNGTDYGILKWMGYQTSGLHQ